MFRRITPLLALTVLVLVNAQLASAEESASVLDATSTAITDTQNLVREVHALARELAAFENSESKRLYFESNRTQLLQKTTALMQQASEAHLDGTIYEDLLKQAYLALTHEFDEILTPRSA